MNAYYNEIEPYAAEWLRNLMRAQGLMAGNSFDPASGDMLDKEPKSFLAISDWRLNGVDQGVHALAGVQSQSRGLRHRIDKPEVRLGSMNKTAYSGYQAEVFPSCALGKSLPFWGGGCGRSERIARSKRVGSHQNRATCYAGLGQFQNASRTPGTHGRVHGACLGASFANGLCSAGSNISDGCENQATRSRTLRSEAANRSFSNSTSYGAI